MNVTHVLAFHRVASSGSFTAAARMFGISQPTLSAQIRALEQVTGVPLFERSGRRVRLTRFGEKLLAETTRLQDVLGDVERMLTGARQTTRGRLRVSADSAVHVLPVLAEIKRVSPAFSFSIRIDNSERVTAQVLADEADVGVMAHATTDQRLYRTKLRQDRLVLLIGVGDPLSRRKRLTLRDLDGRDLVVREQGSITREATEAQLKSAGVTPGQVFDVATREAVRETVAAGFGIGVVFQSEASADPRLRTVALAGDDISVTEYAICLSQRRSLGLVGRFIETARRLAVERAWIPPGDE
jgi:LysR family transcriptional regulator, low CO2-responsive transcriptional regulator